MGLDMYLFGIKKENKSNTQVEIGYLRKANQIHNWFVKNVQDGIDNCETYYVSRENLKNLKSICEEVLLKPEQAKDLLPTKNGFAFGRTEYDERYYNDIKETIKICNNALQKDYDYYEYYSSW